MEKRCTQCGKVKDIGEFHKRKYRPSGVTSECKECSAIRHKKYASQNRDSINTRMRDWYKTHTDFYVNRWARIKQERPEVLKARQKVNNEVIAGRMKSAKNFKCSCCHINQASQYHHHLGYSLEHQLDVIPLCRECHKS